MHFTTYGTHNNWTQQVVLKLALVLLGNPWVAIDGVLSFLLLPIVSNHVSIHVHTCIGYPRKKGKCCSSKAEGVDPFRA